MQNHRRITTTMIVLGTRFSRNGLFVLMVQIHLRRQLCSSLLTPKEEEAQQPSLLLTVVRALSVSFFRGRSLCFFPPAARTLTRVSPPINPRQLGAPQKHF